MLLKPFKPHFRDNGGSGTLQIISDENDARIFMFIEKDLSS